MTTPRSFVPFVLAALVLVTSFALAQSPSPPPPVPAKADTTAPALSDTLAPVPPVRDTTTHPPVRDTTAHAPATPAATSPPAPAATTPPPSPVTGIRNKVSAGDLFSAESILEVYREKNGENGTYLVGLSWLARGAMLLGDLDKARGYVADVQTRCDRKRAAGDTLEKDRDYETALGAAIEVEAQLVERTRGPKAAVSYLRNEIPKIKAPVSLRSRLYKRLNLMSLVGDKAPDLVVDDQLGGAPPPLTGQPTLLFLWAEWCGDARSQAGTLARMRERYEKDGLRIVALTRYYESEAADRVREKARVDSVWKADYAGLAGVPIAFSTTSMERYGGSSTPTYVFVDRTGTVRRYTPTRLTEAELNRSLTALVK